MQNDPDDDLLVGEYRVVLEPEPIPIVTDFMIKWTAANGSRPERWRLLRAIRKRRGATIADYYMPFIIDGSWAETRH